MTAMNAARRAAPTVLWTMQWLLAVAFFLLGLLKVGTPLDDLQQRLHLLAGVRGEALGLVGWLEVGGGLLLVIPSLTSFWPRLTPVAAAYLGVTTLLGAATGAQGASPGAGLGLPGPDLLLGLACVAVAVGRAFLWPIAPIALDPEPEPVPQPRRPLLLDAAAPRPPHAPWPGRPARAHRPRFTHPSARARALDPSGARLPEAARPA
jgi:uncharacterized membrane protein YphA (DoxX/SURF4 family)